MNHLIMLPILLPLFSGSLLLIGNNEADDRFSRNLGAKLGYNDVRSTVYRTLEILASLGILSRILNETGRPVYVAGAPVHRHHLICSGCGAVVPFSACPVGDLAATLAQESGFEVHGHLLEIFGTCRSCQSAPR